MQRTTGKMMKIGGLAATAAVVGITLGTPAMACSRARCTHRPTRLRRFTVNRAWFICEAHSFTLRQDGQRSKVPLERVTLARTPLRPLPGPDRGVRSAVRHRVVGRPAASPALVHRLPRCPNIAAHGMLLAL